MRHAAVLLFVGSLSAPIVNFNPASLPITHDIPVNRFVGAQVLAGTKAGVTPELGNLVEAGKYSCSDVVPLRIAGPDQQNPPGGRKIPNQRPNSFDGVRRD